jgi:uncharacterized RDD family membrane protein YckC/predicted RNA-binding Zn-ribbon protein involved in translation (DUF1610 family)
MSILVSCDACGKELRAKDEAAGKQAKCPNCKAIIRIPHAEEFADAEEYGDTQPSPPVDDFGDDRQPCPACGEMIASTARKCRHCDEVLMDSPLTKSKKKPSRSGRSSRRRAGRYPPADRGKRFLGAFADGFAYCLLMVPGFVMMGAFGDGNGQDNDAMAGIGLILFWLGGLTAIALNIFFLVTRSQSIGKWLVNTQMMDYETHEPAGFWKTFIIRGFVNGVIGLFVPFYGLIDVLFIFGEEHRCVHDQIAGTYVVDIS